MKSSFFSLGGDLHKDLKMFGFWEMLVYIGLVMVGFFFGRRASSAGTSPGRGARRSVMPLEPAVTDLEQLEDRPAVAALLTWNAAAVEGVKWDRGELFDSLRGPREHPRRLRLNFFKAQGLFSSIIFPISPAPRLLIRVEPRFEMAYHLFPLASATSTSA